MGYVLAPVSHMERPNGRIMILSDIERRDMLTIKKEINFKEERLARSLLQREFADLMGVTVSAYQLWEWGKTQINHENYIKIKQILKDFPRPEGVL